MIPMFEKWLTHDHNTKGIVTDFIQEVKRMEKTVEEKIEGTVSVKEYIIISPKFKEYTFSTIDSIDKRKLLEALSDKLDGGVSKPMFKVRYTTNFPYLIFNAWSGRAVCDMFFKTKKNLFDGTNHRRYELEFASIRGENLGRELGISESQTNSIYVDAAKEIIEIFANLKWIKDRKRDVTYSLGTDYRDGVHPFFSRNFTSQSNRIKGRLRAEYEGLKSIESSEAVKILASQIENSNMYPKHRAVLRIVDDMSGNTLCTVYSDNASKITASLDHGHEEDVEVKSLRGSTLAHDLNIT